MSMKKEHDFIDSLISENNIDTRTAREKKECNIEFINKTKQSAIKVDSLLKINEDCTIKDLFSIDEAVAGPVDGNSIEPKQKDEPEVDSLEPEIEPEPTPEGDKAPEEGDPKEPEGEDEPKEEVDEIAKVIEVLFLTGSVKSGANLSEFKTQSMKDMFINQGVSEEAYNSVGKALYNLDINSDTILK